MRLRDIIVSLCGTLKNDAVALVDAVAPPDFVLHSALGHSNGEVSTHSHQWIAKANTKSSSMFYVLDMNVSLK